MKEVSLILTFQLNMLISLIPARRNGYLLARYEWSEILLLAWNYEVLIISFLAFLVINHIYQMIWMILSIFSRCFQKRAKVKEALICPVSWKYSADLATKRNSGALQRVTGNSASSCSHLFQLPATAGISQWFLLKRVLCPHTLSSFTCAFSISYIQFILAEHVSLFFWGEVVVSCPSSIFA